MEDLYKQNSKIVYHFLYSMCQDEALSEELLQETFLKAFESLERFDGSCKISTWLCQIARHLLYQHWHRVNREFATELEEQLSTKEDTEMQAIQRIELADVWDKLQEEKYSPKPKYSAEHAFNVIRTLNCSLEDKLKIAELFEYTEN